MSFVESDMYANARKVLRERYPANDGWEIKFQDKREGYIPDFVVEKIDLSNHILRIIVEVKAEPKISNASISQLNKYSRNLAGKNSFILGKIFIVPCGCDCCNVPDDIEVIYL